MDAVGAFLGLSFFDFFHFLHAQITRTMMRTQRNVMSTALMVLCFTHTVPSYARSISFAMLAFSLVNLASSTRRWSLLHSVLTSYLPLKGCEPLEVALLTCSDGIDISSFWCTSFQWLAYYRANPL